MRENEDYTTSVNYEEQGMMNNAQTDASVITMAVL